MRWLYAVIDLVLYGNFWIASGAFAMCLLSQHLLGETAEWNAASLFVFGGTLFIYGVHRSVGIARLETFLAEKRYGVIFRYRRHIKIYAILGILLAGYHFFALSRNTQLLLILPSLLALGYVLPFLSNKKRLRDINDVKIFLVAICWSGLTVLVPAAEMGLELEMRTYWLFLERALFIFLITLPFDVRDMKVDGYKSVKTLPIRLGISATIKLGVAITLFLFALAIAGFAMQWISIYQLIICCFTYLIAMILLHYSTPDRHDYYYTGLIDGLMFLPSIPIILWF